MVCSEYKFRGNGRICIFPPPCPCEPGLSTRLLIPNWILFLFGRLYVKCKSGYIAISGSGLSTLLDRIGGLMLGVLIAGLLCSAMITGLARLTYSFESDLILKVLETVPEPVGDQVGLSDKLDQVMEVKQELENTLTGSAVVPVFITVTNTIPWNTLGYIPSDFKIALEILGENIE